jgi:hypothetical protein
METWEHFPNHQARQTMSSTGVCRSLLFRPTFRLPGSPAADAAVFRGRRSTQPCTTKGQRPCPCPSAKCRYPSVLTYHLPCKPRPVRPQPTEITTAFRSNIIVAGSAGVHSLPLKGRHVWRGMIQGRSAAVHRDASRRGGAEACIGGEKVVAGTARIGHAESTVRR